MNDQHPASIYLHVSTLVRHDCCFLNNLFFNLLRTYIFEFKYTIVYSIFIYLSILMQMYILTFEKT